jgi:thiamine biosynthesis lipoprotein
VTVALDRHAFRAMGCDVVVSGASASARAAVERLFVARDRMFSRFRPDSELNRVSAAGGMPVRVSQAFADMLMLALEASRQTDGLVHPALGAELEAAGYDRDFSLLHADALGPRTAERRRRVAPRVEGRLVAVPRGTKLDLNGVVKGRTVDDALALFDGDGFVSAGGDLAVRGTLVAALPRGGSVRLVRGALATSGTDRRRWLRDGVQHHHLIDPRTGRPSTSPWEQVTVCGLTCVAADIAAKAAFLLGHEGPEWLDARGLPGRFVDSQGDVLVNQAWSSSLENAIACT